VTVVFYERKASLCDQLYKSNYLANVVAVLAFSQAALHLAVDKFEMCSGRTPVESECSDITKYFTSMYLLLRLLRTKPEEQRAITDIASGNRRSKGTQVVQATK